jgi:GntR family transcriptional regulator
LPEKRQYFDFTEGHALGVLYEKTIAFILSYIDDGGLAAGAKLPTEPQLADLVGVSVVTVRRALAELAAQSVVRREQGRGTFVLRPRVRAETTQFGSLRNGLLLDARSTLTTELLSLTRRSAVTEERQALGLPESSEVWELSRLRRLNGRALIWERSAIPVVRAPTLDDHLPAGRATSLYEVLETKFGLREGREEQLLLTRAATETERDLLGLLRNEWVVEITGTSFSTRQIPIDRFRMVFAGQAFTFRLSSAPLNALEAVER